jgi:hypothetical protein
MFLIVAIEPDRGRGVRLSTMVRAHLKAELVLAAGAMQAIEMLRGRVPDVLLTAPLLPSREEAAIADYLRHLGPAAAHVQTLTIPLLAESAAERGPLRSAFWRERSKATEPEGCDPAVFAEQIAEYLREAHDRRRAAAPTSAPSPAPPSLPSAAPAATTAPTRIPPPVRASAAEPARLPVTPAVPPVLPVDEPLELIDFVEFDLEAMGDELDSEAAAAAVQPADRAPMLSERLAPAETPHEAPVPVEAPAIEDAHLVQLVEQESRWTPETTLETPPVEEIVNIEPPPVAAALVPPPPVPPPPVPPPHVPASAVPAPPVAARPVLVAEPAELVDDAEIIERPSLPAAPAISLMTQPAVPPTNVQQVFAIPTGNGQLHASVNVAVAVSVQVAAGVTVVSAPPAPPKRARKLLPAQDEWGFFDPHQCGFPALLAKLDEIAEREEIE